MNVANIPRQHGKRLKNWTTGPNTQHMEPSRPMEPQVIDAPIVPGVGGMIYQVTLATGAILTNPGAFGDEQPGPREVNPYIAEDGHLLY